MLAVGDSTELEIIFDTKAVKGKASKSPSISTNEGPPVKNVRINADVIERPDSTYPIIIDPYKLDLSQFSEKVIDEKEFTITNVSDQPVELTIVSMPRGLFDLKLPDSIKPGKKAKGKLELRKEAYTESIEKSVTIEVSGPDSQTKTRFTLPVKRSLKMAEATPPPKPQSKPKGTP
ncbi:MAG TPA: hypothetical protein VN285_06130 [Candidatus Deferrimicrobium sp.]|nr:hypothetical protein [Candidatus Deferrimicrobium sp.]